MGIDFLRTFSGLSLLLSGCVPLTPGPNGTPIPNGKATSVGMIFDANIYLDGHPIPVEPASVQFLLRRQLDSRSEMFLQGGTLFSVHSILPYGGAGYRKYLRQKKDEHGSKWSIGGEFSGGVAYWIRAGLPMSYRIGNLPVWLSTNPSVGFSYLGPLNIPVGLDLQAGEHWQLQAHAGTWWFSSNAYDLVHFYATFGLNYLP